MKNLQKKKLLLFGIIISTIAFSNVIYAHGGRTDSSGGHKDKNNVSGLGGYHYHCGGYPAHLHTNGVCPYDNNQSNSNYSTTTKNSSNTYTKTNNSSTTPKKTGNNEEKNQEKETDTEDDDVMIGAGMIGVGGIIGYNIYKSKKKK